MDASEKLKLIELEESLEKQVAELKKQVFVQPEIIVNIYNITCCALIWSDLKNFFKKIYIALNILK